MGVLVGKRSRNHPYEPFARVLEDLGSNLTSHDRGWAPGQNQPWVLKAGYDSGPRNHPLPFTFTGDCQNTCAHVDR